MFPRLRFARSSLPLDPFHRAQIPRNVARWFRRKPQVVFDETVVNSFPKTVLEGARSTFRNAKRYCAGSWVDTIARAFPTITVDEKLTRDRRKRTRNRCSVTMNYPRDKAARNEFRRPYATRNSSRQRGAAIRNS